MKRREFIAGMAGAAAWPLVVQAQQPERMRRIGVLNTFSLSDPQGEARIEAFRQALQTLGWINGRNMLIDVRSTGGDAARTQKEATELVALAPDVILTGGVAGLAPLLQATRTVPIVFVLVADPVG